MIRTSGLTKRYGDVVAVNGVALDVRPGDRYGLLGPNGSGKTTLIRLTLGLVFATSGSIELLGQPVPRRIGSVLREKYIVMLDPCTTTVPWSEKPLFSTRRT